MLKPIETNTGQIMEHVTLPATTADSQKLELCPGLLTLEVLHNEKISVYTFALRARDAELTSREVIDVWVRTIKEQAEKLPPGTTWYRLHDCSPTDMNPPPYFIAKLAELAKHRPDLRGYSAFVIPRNIFTRVMQNLSHKIRSKHINIRLFFSRDEALHWLESEMSGK